MPLISKYTNANGPHFAHLIRSWRNYEYHFN